MRTSTTTRRRLSAFTLTTAAILLALPACKRHDDAEFASNMNLGKAHIENRESDAAVAALTKAVAARPDSTRALRNLARAHLISKEATHAQPALDALTKALKIEPDSPANHYLAGLALSRLERYQDAVVQFERAVQLDPETAALRYQLGRSYEHTARQDKAHEQFLATVRLDPYHASAQYRLAAHARQNRDAAEVRLRTREFQRIVDLVGRKPEHVLEACKYTLPEVPSSPPVSTPAITVRWVDATNQVAAGLKNRAATTAVVIDVAADGRPTLFTIDSGGQPALLRVSPADTFVRTQAGRPIDVPGPFTDCIAGDFFIKITNRNKTAAKHDSLNDIFLIGPTGCRLLERIDATTFVDRTEIAGLRDVKGNAAAWSDYDHDGDLDLLVAGDDGIHLWQNNGQFDQSADDATAAQPPGFENVTERVGITATSPALDVAPFEWDNNIAIDFAVTHGDQPTTVFVNQRAGRYAPLPQPPGPWPAARRIIINDINNDGRYDAVLAAERRLTILAAGGVGRQHLDIEIGRIDAPFLIDYDNDGLLDVGAVGSADAKSNDGMVRIWRNEGPAGWSDVSGSIGLDTMKLPDVVRALPGDFDNDGDTDLFLVTTTGGWRFLRNDGGNVNHQIKIKLVSILTNPTGLGTELDVRSGGFHASRFVSSLPVEIGIGSRTSLDSVRAVWTNGVVNNNVGITQTAAPLTAVEKIVEVGSCPFLFVSTPTGFRFVTDILGNAPVGLSLRRDEFLPADRDEWVYVGDTTTVQPQGGRYVLQVAECYREVLYLDAAELVAVDHPADTEIHPTDKLMPAPFPASELWRLGGLRVPTRVTGDDGTDYTAAARAVDGVFTPPGDLLPPPYRGMCYPSSLVIDFGLLDARRPLVLAMTGWLRYGSASVNIAMSQNKTLDIIPPRLEVETGTNQWSPVDVTVGMPAGKTKTILCDLTGKLPIGARRLRLTTTFEIRWDRIALAERQTLPNENVHRLPPAAADHHWLGFPTMASRGEGHPITPDHADLSDRPPWRTTPEGWCTRYGDVVSLVGAIDGRFVISNAGDAVTLEFDATRLPPLPAGYVRSLFFYSYGLEKDGDHNVVNGDTVGPLPFGTPAADSDDATPDWQLEYNTRFVPHDAFTPNK